MIAFVSGTLAYKGPDSCIVDTGGIGYEMGMSATSLAALPDVGARVSVYTHLQVRDDGISLFGFATMEEKALFGQLIGVSTVGPKMALAALSTYSAQALSGAIMAGDVDAISRIPGIGKKKASRIVLELQGILAAPASADAQQPSNSAARAAVEDLLAMGFTSAEADLALKGAPEGASEAQLLQYALKRLGQ